MVMLLLLPRMERSLENTAEKSTRRSGDNNNNRHIYIVPYIPTEALVRHRSDGLVTVIKQERLKVSFKTMF